MTTVAEMIAFLQQFPPETTVEVVKAYEGNGWYGEGGGGKGVEFKIETINPEEHNYGAETFEYTAGYEERVYGERVFPATVPHLLLGKES